MSNLAISFEPANPSYLDTYGWIQYKIGNYEIAHEYIMKAFEAGGNSFELYEHLGYIQLGLDKKKEAIEAWKKSLELNPDNLQLLKEFKKISE